MEELLSNHEAEIWSCPEEKGPERAYIRIVLPAAETCRPDHIGGLTILPNSRPEFFDFDLFSQPGQNPDVDNRTLDQLSYTVFDTETTGLDPRGGDEIISIGAVRVVNGRILSNERFDQLIDPRRPLPPESTRIHGIRPEMLEGQPTIEEVLPRFLSFTGDTILVAHNAAFDMQMLKMKEDQTGVKFINPVLDTLLLSAVVHPAQEDHSMEAMARRLGVNIVGRHTAIGDALSTAALFLKLIPLLSQQGIRTLKEARLASRKTYYARLKY
jgi:DNA polymerase-3 subunit epsilon